jgi:CHAP domain
MKRLVCCAAAACALLLVPAAASASTTRSRILSLAVRQIGYHDSGYYQCTKYGPCESWCSLFLTWIWRHAGVGVPSLAFTGDVFYWAKDETYVLTRNEAPEPGDAVLFGTGPRTVDTSRHTGIVEGVYGKYIVTIEGNSLDAVRRYVVPIQDPQRVGEPGPIYAFASPVPNLGQTPSGRAHAAAERLPTFSPRMIDRQASISSTELTRLDRAIASLRAFQHMPYRMPNANINWTGVNPNGNVAVRVTSARSLQAASAAWLRFLHRFEDAGHAYQVTFQVAGSSAVVNVPVAASPPSISGTPQVGQTLTAEHATWSNQPTGYTHQWEDCDTSGNSCTPIYGATGRTYTVAATDLGQTIRVEETAVNGSGAGVAATSAQTAVVTGPLIGV